MSAWDKVLLARHADRPTAKKIIELVFDDFIELHGDRLIADDHAIVGGIASFNGQPVTIIAQEKGVSTSEKIYHNFGMPSPEGYHKALRLMKQAEKFNRAIITIIDTPGAYPGIGAEERGQANAIAVAIKEMMNLKVPIISVVLGEGGSGGALAVGVCNSLLMFENSIYSILSPEGFASILFKDSKLAVDAAELMKITAKDLLANGIADSIIKEEKPLNEDLSFGIKEFVKEVKKELNKLNRKTSEELVLERYFKYRKIGKFETEMKEIKQDV